MEKFLQIFIIIVIGCVPFIGLNTFIYGDEIQYKHTIVNETYKKEIPESKWYSNMIIGNIQIPIENTNPAYTDYIICINGMPSYVTTDKKIFVQFHTGDKVKIGYKKTMMGELVETSITKE